MTFKLAEKLHIRRTFRPLALTLEASVRPLPTLLSIAAADAIALATAGIASVYLRLAFNGQYLPSLYWQIWPLLGLFVLAYAIVGLYTGVTLSPADELRRTSLTTTLIYLVLGAATFLLRNNETYSRGVFLLAWAFSLGLVPLCRAIVRHWLARYKWWGFPVMILGAGKTGEMVVHTLQSRPSIGLKPVLVLDDDPVKQRGTLYSVPVVGGVDLAPMLARRLRVVYAIVAMPGVSRHQLLNLLERYGQTFHHLLLIPDLFGFSSLWVVARDLGGVLGLEVRQQLLLPGPRFVKRCLDLLLTVVGGLVMLPAIGAIALAVILDSPGSVFYGHTRLGRNGIPFTAWKFRTMHRDGDRILDKYLQDHPQQRITWERERKLKHDPRVTRVGRFLRRTSLDELPQLWNVLCLEMSLVGPRPIVDAEIPLYGDRYELYRKVTPGITGLWQVSGRSNTSYTERVQLDEYYVRNWSIWLDIYILSKTVWAALRAEGAY